MAVNQLPNFTIYSFFTRLLTGVQSSGTPKMQNDTESITAQEEVYVERNIKLAVYLITIALGLTGNVLVIKDVAKKENRTANDIFIANLAVADLILIIVLPVDIYILFHSFPETAFFCSFFLPFNTVPFVVSIFTLTSMAIHRCHVIVNPFSGRLRQRVAVVWMVVLWLASFALLLPVMVFSEPQRSTQTMCVENWPNVAHQKAYTASLFVIQYLLPLVIITAAYIRIGLDLYQVQLPCTPARRREYGSRAEDQERDRENARVVRTLAIIVILFAVCMFPIQIAWMMWEFGGPREQVFAAIIFKFSLVLAVFHSCLNPLVYGTLTRRLRPLYRKFTVYCCSGEYTSRNHRSVRNETQITTASGNDKYHMEPMLNGRVHNIQEAASHV